MKKHIIVFSTLVKFDNGHEESRYYGYLQEQDKEGNFVDAGFPKVVDGKSTTVNPSFKVILSDKVLEGIKSFPVILELDTDIKVPTEDGKEMPSYTIKPDRNQEGKYRRDKNGKRHLICVVRAVNTVFDLEKRSYDFADMVDYE